MVSLVFSVPLLASLSLVFVWLLFVDLFCGFFSLKEDSIELVGRDLDFCWKHQGHFVLVVE